MIESVNNKKIKEYAKLQQKKERDRTNLFLVEGEHMVFEAFKAHALKELFILEGIQNPIDFPFETVSQAVLNKLSNQNSNSKMIGVCKKLSLQSLKQNAVLLLDHIQDPGNMGTILRTAHSFGIDCIYTSKGCADIYNPKTIQSSQGALFYIPCIQVELQEEMQILQMNGFEIYATALHKNHENLQSISPNQKYGILLGNEGQGVDPTLIEASDHTVKIEMETFESLNVAIAAAICMYTFKHAKKK